MNKNFMSIMLAFIVAMPMVASASGNSNSNNSGGDTNVDVDNNIDNRSSATGGSATAFGGAGGAGGRAEVDVDNHNTNVNVNDLSNRNYSTVNNRNSNRQSQRQAQGQSQKASARQSQSANNEGVNVDASDHNDVRAYSHAAPGAALGTDGVTIGTFLGGVGFSQTSVYAKTDSYIGRLVEARKMNLITEEEFQARYVKALKRLERNSGRNDRGLLNLFGLL